MDSYQSLAITFLNELIKLPTINPPGNEFLAAKWIQGVLREQGIFSEIQVFAQGRANLIAQIGHGSNQIIFSGHLDVVPAGEGWQTDPFIPIQKVGRLYGRGSSDMKGGIAAMMVAAIRANVQGLPENTTLTLAFTGDEEADGLGTKHFLSSLQREENVSVIIGEPTGNQIHIAHRGVTRLRVRVEGRQCHSGQPEHGINAITNLVRVILELEKLHHRRQAIRHALLPSPTVSCTMISGGVKDNVIPGVAECVLDCRTIPGDTAQMLVDEICRSIDLLKGLDPDVKVTVSPLIEVLPGATSLECRTVSAAQNAWRNAFLKEVVVCDFPACCDMSQFTSLGLETIICGPGNLCNAHTVNESIELAQVFDAIEFYTFFLNNAYFN